MHFATRPQAESGVVPLHTAVLCIECESVSMGLSDECLVCGSRSLFNLARLLSGTHAELKTKKVASGVTFNVRIDAGVKGVSSRELSNIVETLANLLRAKQLDGEAELHIDVEPACAQGVIEIIKAEIKKAA